MLGTRKFCHATHALLLSRDVNHVLITQGSAYACVDKLYVPYFYMYS